MSDPVGVLRRLRPDEPVDPELLERQRSLLMAHIETKTRPASASGLPPHGQVIIPQLPYADLEAAVEWLCRAFGFAEAEGARVKGNEGLLHTELRVGDARIMLGGQGGHGAFSPGAEGNPSMFLTVYVSDVDAHHRRAMEAGATICEEPSDRFFGDRVYEAVDPEGHRWRFHQHTGRTWEFSQDAD